MSKMKIGELVFDFDLYPRSDIDTHNIAYMSQAEDAGVKFPPVIIDKKSKRIVDGFHRVKMYRQKYDDNYKIEVIEKTYGSEKEIFLDAIRYNASHGKMLSRHDRMRCVLQSERMRLKIDDVASALSMTIEKINQLKAERVGELRVGGTIQSVPLKRTIRHMSGKRLTKKQSEVNEHISGMDQKFYVNQLVMLIESNLLDQDDEILFQRLHVLWQQLGKLERVKVTIAS